MEKQKKSTETLNNSAPKGRKTSGEADKPQMSEAKGLEKIIESYNQVIDELQKHKEAIRFLLHHSKQFQNEIKKEKFKKEEI